MAARKKLNTVIVIANDAMEAQSYRLPVEYDRLIVAVPGRERVELPATDRVVGIFATPNTRRHPQAWSTEAYLTHMFELDVYRLSENELATPGAVTAEVVDDAETEAE